jgi:hypothetical protein
MCLDMCPDTDTIRNTNTATNTAFRAAGDDG